MVIMITGIAGTVGRAFAELLSPIHKVIGVDHNETNVARLKADMPDIKVLTGDFSAVDLRHVDLVIHLAAMKHIDLCEENPASCIMNNVIRPYELFIEAQIHECDVLFMSTDKAVEPTSVYGYSKALIEAMVLSRGWAVARSGNVLNSNGSVFSIWDKAIEEGKPIKVTHKDMHRYFISPENLVKRIWKLYLDGERLIIPEMDIDAKLMDILEIKLKQKGHDIKNYPIEFIGLRPGEKLREKLR